MKSKLKGGAKKPEPPAKTGPPQVPALNFYQQTPVANTAGETANSASNGGGNSTAATGARAESSSENGAPVVGSHDEDSNIDGSEIIFQNQPAAPGKAKDSSKGKPEKEANSCQT